MPMSPTPAIPTPAAIAPSAVRRVCPFVIVSSLSGYLQQHVDQPLRRVDHYIVAGLGGLERAPGLVGLALRQRLVEGGLRIFCGRGCRSSSPPSRARRSA